MRRVMVRYTVKPEQVAANEQLVRDVYEELARVRPDGLPLRHVQARRRRQLRPPRDARGRENPLPQVAAFRRFQEGIRDRCDEPPVVAELDEVGSFRFDGAAS